jgi:hypothetical protein
VKWTVGFAVCNTRGAVVLVEGYIALGFGLSMFIFFIGQGLRFLTDAVEIVLGSQGRT